ncbi:hypothetical protein RhiirA1_438802 [Rhizophagus irregularis]|uniref:GIY-YIG domain-containing protein n=1 Tax=Rhizophagus irregularis TaxID=588596 RepID=A0A2N0S7M5_9GLOM|nr:hypothetical protein RhiirA1_438802 [Rhizophagus irregularis]
MRSSHNHQSRIESVTGTWCVYVVYNPDRSKVYVGTTRDFKDRIKKHNRPSSASPSTVEDEIDSWLPVIAITGFFNKKDALDFEKNVKSTAKKKEFTEYASLYPGRCPPLVLKRIIAIRCLLCEFDLYWRAPKGKRRRYVLHWGSYMDRDQRQSNVLKHCPWSRLGRYVKHKTMDLSEDRPLAPETDSSNVSVTSEHTNSRKRKEKLKGENDKGNEGINEEIKIK